LAGKENGTMQEPALPAVMIYMTCANSDEAKRLARALVGERLAACANILGPVRSFYWWDGAVQDDGEVALTAKTTPALVDALTARVCELHSYDVPCVVALPLVGGNGEYLAWIGAEATGRPA
jgi:periplasmic divalent cation tolerance protein